MIYIPHVIISFFLVILHTTILNSFWLHSLGFVLLLSFLIFMACHRPVFESLAIVFLIGFLMDSFSGGPFGLFTSTYFCSSISSSLTKSLSIFTRIKFRSSA